MDNNDNDNNHNYDEIIDNAIRADDNYSNINYVVPSIDVSNTLIDKLNRIKSKTDALTNEEIEEKKRLRKRRKRLPATNTISK